MSQSGSTLLIVIMILAVGTTILITAMGTTNTSRKLAGMRTGSEKVQQSAETCLNRAIYTAQEVMRTSHSVTGLICPDQPTCAICPPLGCSLSQTIDGNLCVTRYTDNVDMAPGPIDMDGTIYVSIESLFLKTGARSTMKVLINLNLQTAALQVYSVADE